MNGPTHISVYLNKLKNQVEKKVAENCYLLDVDWIKMVGRDLGTHSKIIGIKNKKLLIGVENSLYLFELNTKKRDILEKMKYIKRDAIINDVKFVIHTEERKDVKDQ